MEEVSRFYTGSSRVDRGTSIVIKECFVADCKLTCNLSKQPQRIIQAGITCKGSPKAALGQLRIRIGFGGILYYN